MADIKERTKQLIDNVFIGEFLKQNFNYDEKYLGIRYMLFYSDNLPVTLLPKVRELPAEVESDLSIQGGFRRLLVNLILTDYSLRDDVNHLRKLRRV
jgi:hypothetical protein